MKDDPAQKRNIILVGFMGTGKTRVGQALARRLGWPFRDLDEEIVGRTGLSIGAIFEDLGEPYFRRLEKTILAEVCRRERQVIAAGGGVICDRKNLEIMREGGMIVCLAAAVNELISRLEGDESRPLLSGPTKEAEMERLMKQREADYRQADVTLDTTGRSPEEIAREIEALAREGGMLSQ